MAEKNFRFVILDFRLKSVIKIPNFFKSQIPKRAQRFLENLKSKI